MKLRVWLYKIFLLLAAALLAFLLVSPRLQAAGPADEAPLSVETPEPEPESTPTPEPTPEPPPRYADCEASMETPAGPLCINEIVMAGGDAVELRNLSDQPVQLSNYYLSDKNKNRLLLQLPEQMLEPGGLFVTEELSLSVKGERLWLSDADENVLDYANAAELLNEDTACSPRSTVLQALQIQHLLLPGVLSVFCFCSCSVAPFLDFVERVRYNIHARSCGGRGCIP